MAKYSCCICHKGLGSLLTEYAHKCKNPACGKIFCEGCLDGWINKKCPHCGNQVVQLPWP
jgi:hypothetical protein